MTHYVKVRIKTKSKSKVLLKLNELNINLKNITYNKNYMNCTISLDDLKRLKKYYLSLDIEVLDEVGIFKVKKQLKTHHLFYLSLILGVIIFYIFSNIIVKINVIDEDSRIRSLILSSLKEQGVYPLSFKKSYQDYEKIITNIKETYKDEIEWLEIDVTGMVINVRLEKRIINKDKITSKYCHLIANKTGVIKSILTTEGTPLVKINDYVHKGDTLISGEIKLNEEIKNNVCASGIVFAEVWYNTHITLPLEYEEVKKTGKMRYNLKVKTKDNEYKILKSRVKNPYSEDKLLFKVGPFSFYKVLEYESFRKEAIYTEEEAVNLALEKVREKIKQNKDFKQIIAEKVLQKNVNNDNLDMDIFLVVEEKISLKKEYEVEMDSDNSDKKYNGYSNGVT